MKKLLMAVMVAVACAGCTTSVHEYKGVSIETDGSGKVVRRVENESVEQNRSTTKELKFKNLDY